MIRVLGVGCYLMILVVVPIMCVRRSNETWIEHNARVARFLCSTPQPRSFDLGEILPENSALKTTAGTIYPQRTVLYRCEHAGCCKGVKRCLPNKIDEVQLVFAVSTLDRRPNIQYIQITALNHTECACQNRRDKPKK